MATFNEAQQVRLSLKMNLSNYSWYNGSTVIPLDGDFIILVHVSRLDNDVKKVIPILYNNVSIKTELSR
jgi:hypothetical protein